MQASQEIRRKLAFLIGNLVCRCMDEARLIPYILNQEEIIGLLVDDPDRFEKLVHEEHADQTEYSKKDLTVKLDAIAELGRIKMLDALEKELWTGSEPDLAPVLDLINQLSRTFAVYVGNASTLFDKNFEDFMDKFRRSLQGAGMVLKAIDFTIEDMAILSNNAKKLVSEGEFLQAFTFDRLLCSQIMMKQVVNLPESGFSLCENLFRHAAQDADLFSALAGFAIRISYISHGAWDDIFAALAKLIYQEPGLCSPQHLISLIEQDVVFSCNLLCKSFAELKQLSYDERISAIESGLKDYSAGAIKPASLDL
jgi:hypothetical protein